MFCGVTNHLSLSAGPMDQSAFGDHWGCFSRVDLDPLILVKGNLDASVYRDILDNYASSCAGTVCIRPFSVPASCTPVRKQGPLKLGYKCVMEELDWPPPCLTLQMLIWMNKQRFPQARSRILQKAYLAAKSEPTPYECL